MVSRFDGEVLGSIPSNILYRNLRSIMNSVSTLSEQGWRIKNILSFVALMGFNIHGTKIKKSLSRSLNIRAAS